MSPRKVFYCEFCEIFKNIYFVEYLRMTVSQLVRYEVYIFLPKVRLEEEEEYKKTPECFDELFVVVKNLL